MPDSNGVGSEKIINAVRSGTMSEEILMLLLKEFFQLYIKR